MVILSEKIDIDLPATAETPFNVPAIPVFPGPEGRQAILGAKVILHPNRTSAGTISLLHTIHLSCLLRLRQCLYLCTHKTKKITASCYKPDGLVSLSLAGIGFKGSVSVKVKAAC